MGVWYSNGKVMWHGRPFEYHILGQSGSVWFSDPIQIPTIWIPDKSGIQIVAVFLIWWDQKACILKINISYDVTLQHIK